MNYWLLKSEGTSYSIDDLKRDKVTAWTGIRNYQARNFMMQMEKGDLILFYHSQSDPNGVYGIAKVAAKAHLDETQFDKKNYHFEPRATKEKPVWYCPDIMFVEKLENPVSLTEIKLDPELEGMMLRRRARLSVQPVSEKHFRYIREMLG
jgi:predicted RNA-binding protein with PUA-like domain